MIMSNHALYKYLIHVIKQLFTINNIVTKIFKILMKKHFVLTLIYLKRCQKDNKIN